MNKVKIWSRLAQRAETQVSNALVQVVKARRRVEELASSEARLHELHADYVLRLRKVESESHAMSQNMMCRRYIANVEALLEKLGEAQMALRETLACAQKKRLTAEIERAKMQHLEEREEKKLLLARKTHEQRQLDNIAITRFNLR